MQSKRLVFRSHGKPSASLEVEDFVLPELKEGEVLLEIRAAPVNPADLNFIEGTYGIKPTLPATAGMECYGTVIHSRSAKFREGEGAVPLRNIGSWATHAVVPADHLIPAPPNIDPLQAAMLKVNPATAWLLLHHFTDLKPGDWVTLNAANSGVGQCVIQIAKSLGIHTLCFLRDATRAVDLNKLGATLAFSDTNDGFGLAKAAMGKSRAKLAFNAVGGDSALRLLKLLGDGGTHITYGAMARKPLTIPNGPLIFGDLRLRGLWVTKWTENAPQNELHETYAHLAQRIVDGSLRQAVDSTHALQDFRAALARLDAEDRHGKIVFANSFTV